MYVNSFKKLWRLATGVEKWKQSVAIADNYEINNTVR